MTDKPKLEHILVCADASTASKRALDVAVEVAKGVTAKVSAKHVFDVTRVDPELGHFLDDEELASLKSAVRKRELDWADVDNVDVDLVEGRSVPALLELSEKSDLVVVGHSGQSPVAEFLLGSVTKHLVAHAKAPVLVVQSDDETATAPVEGLRSRAIVCAVDGSNPSTRALRLAAMLAERFKTRLEILTVADVSKVDIYDGFYMNEEQLAKMESRTHQAILEDARPAIADYDVNHSERIVRGDTKDVLLEETRRADIGLFVIGRTGKGAFEQMLQGSVSRALTSRAGCPVVVVP